MRETHKGEMIPGQAGTEAQHRLAGIAATGHGIHEPQAAHAGGGTIQELTA
jgi:hypothetical protein